jgi:hypothetical protein
MPQFLACGEKTKGVPPQSLLPALLQKSTKSEPQPSTSAAGTNVHAKEFAPRQFTFKPDWVMVQVAIPEPVSDSEQSGGDDDDLDASDYESVSDEDEMFPTGWC